MRNSVVFVALSALGLAAAAGNFTIDPNAVSLTDRANWCTAQGNTCNTLCENSPTANSCDPASLNFTCLCHNGSTPGLQYYLQTMPTFICLEAYSECNEANTGNAAGQRNCTTSIRDECGTLDPANFTAPAPSSSAPAPSATDKAAATSAATGASSPSGSAATTSSTNAAPTAMAHYGNGAAAVALGVFAYLL